MVRSQKIASSQKKVENGQKNMKKLSEVRKSQKMVSSQKKVRK